MAAAPVTIWPIFASDPSSKLYGQRHLAEAANCLEGEQPCRTTPELDLELGRYVWWIQAANEITEGKWSVGMVFNVYAPDKMAALVGTWPGQGTWHYDLATARWQWLTVDAQQLVLGDLDGDGRGDLAGVWPCGLWVKPFATGQWLRLTSQLPSTFTIFHRSQIS